MYLYLSILDLDEDMAQRLAPLGYPTDFPLYQSQNKCLQIEVL